MVDNDTGWPVCMRHGDCCRREHEALEPASCCAVERRAFTEPELWCARVYVNLRLRIANAGPTHDLLLGNPRIAALEGPIVTKRFHRAAASKRVSEVKGLVNLDVAGHDVVVTALGMKKRAPDRHDGWCLDIRRPGGDPFHDPP